MVTKTNPRVRRTQQDRTDLTRGKILGAAISLLKREGYASLRMASIAKEAGLSVGALTHHFSKKDELVLAAFELLFSKAMAEAAAHAEKIRPDGDVLHLIVRDSIEWFVSEDFAVVMDLLSTGGRDAAFRSELVKIARPKREALQETWVQAMRRAGYPEEQSRDILWLSISVARGLIALEKLWGNWDRTGRLLTLWEEMVMEFIPPAKAEPETMSRHASSRRKASPG